MLRSERVTIYTGTAQGIEVPFLGSLGVGWGFLLQRPSQRVRGRGDNELGTDTVGRDVGMADDTWL